MVYTTQYKGIKLPANSNSSKNRLSQPQQIGFTCQDIAGTYIPIQTDASTAKKTRYSGYFTDCFYLCNRNRAERLI